MELTPSVPAPEEEQHPADGPGTGGGASGAVSTGTGGGGCLSAGGVAPAGLALLGLWTLRRPRRRRS